MQHGITPENWENYLEGTLVPDERDHIEAHLIGCVSCWEFHERLANLTERLQSDGRMMSHRYPLSNEALQAGLRATYARICERNSSAAVPTSVQQRLHELEAVMTVFCGEQTAVNALQAAAKNSPAKRLLHVSPENWESFLNRLTALAHVLCGNTGAQLVFECGRL